MLGGLRQAERAGGNEVAWRLELKAHPRAVAGDDAIQVLFELWRWRRSNAETDGAAPFAGDEIGVEVRGDGGIETDITSVGSRGRKVVAGDKHTRARKAGRDNIDLFRLFTALK